MKPGAGVGSLITGLMLLAACSEGSTVLQASDAWARPSPPVGNTAAFYLTIVNSSAVEDRLIGASSSFCQQTELHRTVLTGDVTSMPAADTDLLGIEVGGSLELEPNGLHIMCLGVAEPLVEGEEVPLTLQFSEAGDIEVRVTIEQR